MRQNRRFNKRKLNNIHNVRAPRLINRVPHVVARLINNEEIIEQKKGPVKKLTR